MKVKYKSPDINIIEAPCYILVSSAEKDHPCSNYCKFWHICRDRELGKICADFQYKL